MDETLFIVIQCLGFCAVAADFSSSVQLCARRALMLLVVSSFFWAIHFSLLGATEATAMAILWLLRSALGIHLSKKYMLHLAVTFIVGAWISCFLFYQNEWSLLPSLGVTLGSLALLFRDDILKFRALCIMSNIAWFPYYYVVGSHAGMATETIIFVGCVICLARYYHKKTTVPATI